MWWLPYVVTLGAAGAAGRTVLLRRRRRTADRAGRLRVARSACDSDVTTYGERLAELHLDTLTTPLDGAIGASYQEALDCYETAKQRLREAREPDDVRRVTEALAEGRFHVACVLADRDGEPRPERRPPCFFDPAHGPSSREVTWTPPGGVAREVPVCFRDAQRLAEGEQPDVRLLPWGDVRVPWYRTGAVYGPWADGYYRGAVERALVPAFVLGAATTTWGSSVGGWAGFGGVGDLGGVGFDGSFGGGGGPHIVHGPGDAGFHGGVDGGHDGSHGGFDAGGHGGFGDMGGGDGGN